jgi:hypothetical protein
MPSFAGTKGAYQRALAWFHDVEITHGETTATVKGRLYAETADQMSDSIQQSRMKAIVEARALPFTPARGDILKANDASVYHVIQSVDDFTRSLEGEVLAYEITL